MSPAVCGCRDFWEKRSKGGGLSGFWVAAGDGEKAKTMVLNICVSRDGFNTEEGNRYRQVSTWRIDLGGGIAEKGARNTLKRGIASIRIRAKITKTKMGGLRFGVQIGVGGGGGGKGEDIPDTNKKRSMD